MTPDASPARETSFRLAPLTAIIESPMNPRRHYDPTALKELTDSVRTHGVLTPLLVRPHGEVFEIAAGHRRYRAAKEAALEEIPVLVRPMTDVEFLEIITMENLQHEDLHPLDEAEGYQQLLVHAGYDVRRIAERIGLSTKYVYDRVRLLSLTTGAKQLFLTGKITAGHAILLARLSPQDQTRAIDPTHRACFQHETAELFTPEELHGVPEPSRKQRKSDPYDGLKAVSVRELETWINDHVRFVPEATDLPMLFPETHQALHTAAEQEETVVKITHEHYVQPEARDEKERTYGPRSWRRADGQHRSKLCASSVIGVIVAGPARGEAFKVCTDKKGCKTHWAREQREAKRRGEPRGISSQQERWKQEQARREAERAKEDAKRERWKKALPAVLKAVGEKVRKAPAHAKGVLADLIVAEVSSRRYGLKVDRDTVPRGTTAEDLVRHAAFLILQNEAADWQAPEAFPKRARAFGIDVRAILDQVAPIDTPKDQKAQGAQTSAKRGK